MGTGLVVSLALLGGLAITSGAAGLLLLARWLRRRWQWSAVHSSSDGVTMEKPQMLTPLIIEFTSGNGYSVQHAIVSSLTCNTKLAFLASFFAAEFP
jgi:hypothetical protein